MTAHTPSHTVASRRERTRPLPARKFHGNRYVYTVISQRAGGLSIGVNLNPDHRCNFDCIYCEIDRCHRGGSRTVNVASMVHELARMLDQVRAGRAAGLGYEGVPAELLALKEVAISGDGEPTLCPNFLEALTAIVKLRERLALRPFKLVLITNSTGLGLPWVREGIAALGPNDEVWAKLDAGTQAYMDLVNRPGISLDAVLTAIRDIARVRPVVIQSLFPMIDGCGPDDVEIEAFAQNLLELKEDGARISLVQIYSAHRAAMDTQVGHLPLRTLSRIAQRVREISGLAAEVF